ADNNSSVQIEWHLKSDSSVELGGWTIDDVELGTRTTPPLPAQLQMVPEQAAANQAMVLTVLTNGPQPFVLGIGDTQGPTLIPGIPPVLVGGNLTTLSGFTNAFGLTQVAFTAFPGAPATGLFWYSQVVTLDPTSAIVVSNPCITLFTP
ncbi:MAG TPA: hypothetical protein VFA35_05480, partial [Burkholderiaceae bacterium]|nr:hypothetical protein [Burkholderiaceae bacterium]